MTKVEYPQHNASTLLASLLIWYENPMELESIAGPVKFKSLADEGHFCSMINGMLSFLDDYAKGKKKPFMYSSFPEYKEEPPK
jgi:hypothetical protein